MIFDPVYSFRAVSGSRLIIQGDRGLLLGSDVRGFKSIKHFLFPVLTGATATRSSIFYKYATRNIDILFRALSPSQNILPVWELHQMTLKPRGDIYSPESELQLCLYNYSITGSTFSSCFSLCEVGLSSLAPSVGIVPSPPWAEFSSRTTAFVVLVTPLLWFAT